MAYLLVANLILWAALIAAAAAFGIGAYLRRRGTRRRSRGMATRRRDYAPRRTGAAARES